MSPSTAVTVTHPYAQPGPARGGFTTASSVAKDIVARADELAAKRAFWETEWKEIADYFLPSASNQMTQMGGKIATYDRLMERPATREAARRRYDSTALLAIDRLASGMESLVTPQSEQWHGLDIDDALAAEATDAEKAWFERVTKFLFRSRYDARSGWTQANQKAIRATCALGTAVIYTEESFGFQDRDHRRTPFVYSHRPLSETFLDVNAQEEHDTCFRRVTRTARQLVQRFGDRVSTKVHAAADDAHRQDDVFEVIHAVEPRREIGGSRNSVRRAPYASFYVEVESGHVISESGYFEFPFSVYTWLRNDNSPYGESPAMLALDDVRGLNVTKKSAQTAYQQFVRPPLAVAHDGVMNRPNLNSGAVNYGSIDANGRLKIQPVVTSQNPGFAREIIKDEQETVRALLFNNLFQILVQNPQMTATEALLRNNEKGELLGPAGSNLQAPMARMVDREIGILDRKGAFARGAALEIPASLDGRPFGSRFTSPLDRLRRAKEASGILITYQAAGQLASFTGRTDVFDNFDDDAALKVIAEANGSPASIQRPAEAVAAIREARQQAAEAAANAKMAESMAKTAKDGVPAAAQAMALMGGNAPSTAPLPLPQIAPSQAAL